MSLMISFILFLLIIVHLYLGLCIAKFFSLSKKKWIIMLGIIFLLLTICFPLSLIIIHLAENSLTRIFYYLSGLWIGLLINLILATIPILLIYVFIKISRKILKEISISFFIIAIIITTHGAWKAQNPVITEIEVPIKNLSQEWDGKTIIQLSDVHLGYIYKTNFLEKIVNKVNAQNPEIIFITGDLFDGMGVNPDEFYDLLNQLSAKKGVYFVTGNHESYAGLERVLTSLRKTNINILDDEIIEINDLQIIGLSFPQFDTSKNISEIIQPGRNFDQTKPSILLYHTPTNINSGNDNSHDSAYWTPNTDFSYAKNLGINLQLSGHSHSGQIFPFNILTYYIYNGYEYGLHTDEDFSIYTSSGTGTWGPSIRTGTDSEIVKIKLVNKLP